MKKCNRGKMIPVFTHGRTCSAEKSRLSLNLIN